MLLELEENRRERSVSQAKIAAENLERKQRSESRKSRESSTASSIKKPVNEFDDKPKKLDDIFGKLVDARATPASPEPVATAVYVDPNFDPGQKFWVKVFY